MFDRDSYGAFNEGGWPLCSEHDEQPEDGGREEACLLMGIHRTAQLAVLVRIAQRGGERFAKTLEASLNEPSAAGVIGAELHCGVA